MVIGVISDTHGKMHANALKALEGSELIIHAGDIGSPQILEALQAIAPVHAVRGNVDKDSWAMTLPLTEALEVEGKLLYLIHNIDMLDLEPKAAGIDMVIYGHSHSPRKEERKSVLYFNPGSAGPRRFKLPICLGRIEIKNGIITSGWVDLE